MSQQIAVIRPSQAVWA